MHYGTESHETGAGCVEPNIVFFFSMILYYFLRGIDVDNL